jgi:hypothetical protein
MIDCSPMRARITADACLKMSITRPECEGCERVNPATPKEKFHHFFNSTQPRKKRLQSIIILERKKDTSAEEKPVRAKSAKKKRVIRKKVARCYNCKVEIHGHINKCKPCTNAKGDALLLAKVRRKRKSGKIKRGRSPGFQQKKMGDFH